MNNCRSDKQFGRRFPFELTGSANTLRRYPGRDLVVDASRRQCQNRAIRQFRRRSRRVTRTRYVDAPRQSSPRPADHSDPYGKTLGRSVCDVSQAINRRTGHSASIYVNDLRNEEACRGAIARCTSICWDLKYVRLNVRFQKESRKRANGRFGPSMANALEDSLLFNRPLGCRSSSNLV